MEENSTCIWVDADACPVAIKEILFKAANRVGVSITFVANQAIHIPKSKYIHFLHVPQGFDVADDEIVNRINKGDLVITQDIPLASLVINKGGHVISPRGERYTQNDIRARLSQRDFMEILRGSGVQTGGPKPFGHKERQAFSDKLDTFLTALMKRK